MWEENLGNVRTIGNREPELAANHYLRRTLEGCEPKKEENLYKA